MNQICTLPLTYHHTLNFCHWQPDTLIFDHIIFSCNDLVVTSSITMSKVRGEVVTCINIHHRFQVCTAEFTSFCDWQDCFKIVLRLSNFLAILQMLQWAMCNKTLHGYPINFVLFTYNEFFWPWFIADFPLKCSFDTVTYFMTFGFAYFPLYLQKSTGVLFSFIWNKTTAR